MRIALPGLIVASLLVLPAAADADSCTGTPRVGYCTRDAAPYVQITSAAPSWPRAGGQTTLTAHGSGRDVGYAWDLDGDGAYDDAFGATVTHAFSAGMPVIGVQATDTYGRTATETRTLTVHAFDAMPVPQIQLSLAAPTLHKSFDVTASGTDVDGSVTKIELDTDGDGTYDVSSAGPGAATRSVRFDTAGLRTLRARVTDDAGETAVATAQVDVTSAPQPPDVTINVRPLDGLGDDPHIAGGVETVTGYATDADGPIARYEFDLDGDGTYETDGGTHSSVDTTFTAGPREVGVRVTDSDGQTATSRRTLNVVLNSTGGYPTLTWELSGGAVTGVPFDLAAMAYGVSETVTYSFDADGDGAFDDGTTTGPGDLDRVVHVPYTYTSPGVYRARVRMTSPHGGVHEVMQTVTVRDPLAAGISSINLLHNVFPAGYAQDIIIHAISGLDLSYDTDGDGQFDDSLPSSSAGVYSLTLNGPATIAVKATAGASSVVDTVELTTLPGDLGAYAHVYPGEHQIAGPAPFSAGQSVGFNDYLERASSENECCLGPGSWDLDGDGQYDDGEGAVRTTLSAGLHTVGFHLPDGGTVHQSFLVPSRPPSAAFTTSAGTATATGSDPDGRGIAAYAWDLDGDGSFDDGTGATVTLLPGRALVGVKIEDGDGDVGIFYANPASVPAPPVVPVDPVAPIDPVAPVGPVPSQPITPAASPLALAVSMKAPSLRAALAQGLRIKVSCGTGCAPSVTATYRGKVVGRAHGKPGTLKLKFNASGKRALRKVRRAKLTLTIHASGAKTIKQTVTLKR